MELVLKARDASASVGSNPTLSAIAVGYTLYPAAFSYLCVVFYRSRIIFSRQEFSLILLRFVNITLIMVVLGTLSRKYVV